jgi:hypothetical protein
MTIMTIIETIIIITITSTLYAGALIQQDPNLISIDGSMRIKIASIHWQGWKIEASEPKIMKLI